MTCPGMCRKTPRRRACVSDDTALHISWQLFQIAWARVLRCITRMPTAQSCPLQSDWPPCLRSVLRPVETSAWCAGLFRGCILEPSLRHAAELHDHIMMRHSLGEAPVVPTSCANADAWETCCCTRATPYALLLTRLFCCCLLFSAMLTGTEYRSLIEALAACALLQDIEIFNLTSYEHYPALQEVLGQTLWFDAQVIYCNYKTPGKKRCRRPYQGCTVAHVIEVIKLCFCACRMLPLAGTPVQHILRELCTCHS